MTCPFSKSFISLSVYLPMSIFVQFTISQVFSRHPVNGDHPTVQVCLTSLLYIYPLGQYSYDNSIDTGSLFSLERSLQSSPIRFFLIQRTNFKTCGWRETGWKYQNYQKTRQQTPGSVTQCQYQCSSSPIDNTTLCLPNPCPIQNEYTIPTL